MLLFPSRIPLDPEQAEACSHRRGVLMLAAGPGTGKTRVLTERFTDLVAEGWAPQSILCVSFTKTAAKEMSERIAINLGIRAEDLKGSCRTFHSLGYQILRANPPFEMDRSPVVGKDFQRSLIEQSLRPGVNVSAARAHISLMKKGLVTPGNCKRDTPLERSLAEVYTAYQAKLRELKKIDFDDMIFEAVQILYSKRDVLEALRKRYRHVQIDEVQDSNFAQHKMATLISRGSESTLLVGDLNQKIYGFAGADSTVLTDESMTQWYPGHVEKLLTRNYRSHAGLVPVFKSAIRAPSGLAERLIKGLHARLPMPPGFSLEARLFDDKDQEGKEIISLVAARTRRPEAAPLDSVAVLFRTNAQSRAFEDYCSISKVPYRSAGTGFYERTEVRLGLALLSLVSDPNYHERNMWADTVEYEWSLRRVAGAGLPGLKGLGKKIFDWCERTNPEKPYNALPSFPDMTPARRWAVEKLHSTLCRLHESAKNDVPSMALQKAYQLFEVYRWAADSDEPGEGDSWRQENLNELVVSASRFGLQKDFLDYAQSRFMYAVGRKEGVDALTLSTIHKAKGREWDTVFLAGVSAGVLPHKRAEDPDEEDRLLYVATSRARRNLWVSGFDKPSWFLEAALRGENGFFPMLPPFRPLDAAGGERGGP